MYALMCTWGLKYYNCRVCVYKHDADEWVMRCVETMMMK